MKKQLFILWIIIILLQAGLPDSGEGSMIDLSTFDIVDPTITFSGINNSSATMQEDMIIGPIALLDNDLVVPGSASTLSFDYRLTVGATNEDYFDFYFGDLSSPYFSTGGFDGIYTGTITEAVSSYSGGNIPIAFSLMYGFGDSFFDLTSTLEISNVKFNQNQVPEPSSFFLFVTGILVFAGYGRKKL